MSKEHTDERKEPGHVGPSESRAYDTAEGFQEWGADWDAWLAEKVARREQWLKEGRGHGSALSWDGLKGGNSRKFGRAVHVVKGDDQTLTRAEFDDLARHLWRQGLAALVVADVSLGATDAVGHRLLCDAETFSDGLEVVHAQIVAPLGYQVNSGDILLTQQRL